MGSLWREFLFAEVSAFRPFFVDPFSSLAWWRIYILNTLVGKGKLVVKNWKTATQTTSSTTTMSKRKRKEE